MKKVLFLLSIFLLFIPFVLSQDDISDISTFSDMAVYDEGPASDTILASEIITNLQSMKNDDGAFKWGNIPANYSKLFSQIDRNNLDSKITLLIYNGKVIIISGNSLTSQQSSLLNDLQYILFNVLHVNYRIAESSYISINNLIELFQQSICTDTDGGVNLYEKGTAYNQIRSLTDLCLGVDVVDEMFCDNNGNVDSTSEDCPSGYKCEDGACVEENISTDTYWFGGGDEMVLYSKSVKLLRVGSDGSVIVEVNGVSKTIPHGGVEIINGLQISPVTTFYDYYKGGAELRVINKNECTDSDGGKNYYEKGTTSDSSGSMIDYCDTNEERVAYKGYDLYEYYCMGPQVNGAYILVAEGYKCPNGCKDGVCIGENNKENNYYVLHRIVKDCRTKDSTTGEQLIFLDIFMGGNYGNYICQSRYDEQCITDGSFDTYYDEWCDYTDKNVCGETGFCTKGVDDINSVTKPAVSATEETNNNKNSNTIISNGINSMCNGCLDSNDNCVPVGVRTGNEFCGINKELKQQLQADEYCNNNFECDSNVCVSNKCLGKGFLEKILAWFTSLFGG